MKIVVVGCGKIGISIINALDEDEHDITVLEVDEERVQRIIETHDVLALCVDGTDFRELKAVDMKNTDWVIATTNSDESNLMTCYLAKRYGAKHTVCQVRKHEYTPEELDNIEEAFNIDLLYSPDLIAAEEIYSRIKDFFKTTHPKRKRVHNVMLMGASKIGIHLARQLDKANYIVKLIEHYRDRCYEVAADLGETVNVMWGDGTEKTLLFEEGIKEIDAFVSLTGVDEENLLMSLFAQSHNVPKVIAKVDRNDFDRLSDTLGITELVSPKIVSAEAVKNFITNYEGE